MVKEIFGRMAADIAFMISGFVLKTGS